MNRRILIPIILVVALIGGGIWWFFGRATAATGAESFSGMIEADEVDITSEVSGKVERLLVDDGVQVKVGDTLIALNTDLLNAQVAQAQAQVQQLAVQIAKATIKAPIDGVVLERVINLGEQAAPGNILLKIGSLAKVKLTIYVPEDRIGALQVRQGVPAHVQVDSFPNRTFDGMISYIAPQAEFTPRNVQTKEERATTVFAVRIELPNPDGALKPGMPADAKIAIADSR